MSVETTRSTGLARRRASIVFSDLEKFPPRFPQGDTGPYERVLQKFRVRTS